MCSSRKEQENLESLAARSRTGDEGAFSRLFVQMLPLLKNRALRYASEYDGETDDLMQEGAIGLFRAVKRYQSESGTPFAAFAAVCVENSIRSAVRRSNREKRRVPEGSVSIGEIPEQMADQTPAVNPEKAVIAESGMAETMRAVSEQLTDLEKKVFSEYAEGCSYQEIARKLKISSKAVDNSLQRIRKKLRRALAK